MFLTMFKKNQNIVLTMHISDVFGKKYFDNLLTNTRMVKLLYYKSMNIVNPNHF